MHLNKTLCITSWTWDMIDDTYNLKVTNTKMFYFCQGFYFSFCVFFHHRKNSHFERICSRIDRTGGYGRGREQVASVKKRYCNPHCWTPCMTYCWRLLIRETHWSLLRTPLTTSSTPGCLKLLKCMPIEYLIF